MDENNWNKYVIECATHRQASVIAADMDLWLHAWTWLENTRMGEGEHRLYINEQYLGE
jgi:hypothetical protein